MFDFVFHGKGQVTLAVKCTRNDSNGATRNQLTHKDNAAPPGVGGFFADIKAQVHFFKIAMQRNGKTEQACVEKQETDDAQERFAIFKIEFSSRRNEWRDDRWIDNVIEHRKIAPVGGEERLHSTVRDSSTSLGMTKGER